MKVLTTLILLSTLFLSSITIIQASSGPYCDERCTDDQWAAIIAIQQAADIYGVSRAKMYRVAWCESKLGDQPNGDGGHSFGLFQLNDRETGLVWHFYRQGYPNPFDHYMAADYYARVLSGEWRSEGVTEARWSCR